MKKHIILLEDDQSFGYILSEYLMMQNFDLTWVKSGEAFIDKIEKENFDLAILDIMLPGIDGFETAVKLSKINKDLPFIFLSAKSLKIDQLKAYKLGAFDYITKPVDEELLVAKIQVLTGKLNQKPLQESIINLGEFEFHHELFCLKYKEERIALTGRENELLLMLCENKNALTSRKLALKSIWNSTDEFSRRSMDVFISHLRKYLSKDPRISIDNIHGQGFILRCP